MKIKLGTVVIFWTMALTALDNDLPALSDNERALLKRAKVAGTIAGGVLGAAPIAKGAYKYGKKQNSMAAISLGVGTVGASAGYQAANLLGSFALARWHKVSYRVEKISHYYDINIDQYRAILVAAELKDRVALRSAIAQIYSQRFGADWLLQLRECFNKYGKYPMYLFAEKQSVLSQEEKELRRMIQLGAAIENIYFNKKPSRAEAVREAAKIYPFLGFSLDKGVS